MNDLVFIGIINGTHHLAGTVKVNYNLDEIEFLKNQKIIVVKDNDKKLLSIKNIKRMNNKKILIDFDEIRNLEEAKLLSGFKIYVRKDLIPNYEEKKSIIGYKVFDKGIYIGEVIDILETAAHEILIVDGEKEIMIPFIDVFVENVNDDNESIAVKLIEGML